MEAVIGLLGAGLLILIGAAARKMTKCRKTIEPFKVVQTRAELVSEEGEPLDYAEEGNIDRPVKPLKKAKKKPSKKKSKKSKR